MTDCDSLAGVTSSPGELWLAKMVKVDLTQLPSIVGHGISYSVERRACDS